MGQPIIRGIQAVGAVDIYYKYNGPKNILTVPKGLIKIPAGVSKTKDDNGTEGTATTYAESLDTSKGISVAGFRLDSEFLRANPQIASSIIVPVLGGGGVAVTNNNRTGRLVFNCTAVSAPNVAGEVKNDAGTVSKSALQMYTAAGFGALSQEADGSTKDGTAFDLVLLAQIQQSQVGGDSAGATIDIHFSFNTIQCGIMFEGCTVENVDPIGLNGNNATDYNVSFNYLNWRVRFETAGGTLPICSFA